MDVGSETVSACLRSANVATEKRCVVFLDVDSVVMLLSNREAIDQSCMRCLKYLVASSGETTELELSSNWKRSPSSLERLNAALVQHGIRPIQSVTPECEYDERGLARGRNSALDEAMSCSARVPR
jgi:hypothetical protein